jgi:hypothetical protein
MATIRRCWSTTSGYLAALFLLNVTTGTFHGGWLGYPAMVGLVATVFLEAGSLSAAEVDVRARQARRLLPWLALFSLFELSRSWRG